MFEKVNVIKEIPLFLWLTKISLTIKTKTSHKNKQNKKSKHKSIARKLISKQSVWMKTKWMIERKNTKSKQEKNKQKQRPFIGFSRGLLSLSLSYEWNGNCSLNTYDCRVFASRSLKKSLIRLPVNFWHLLTLLFVCFG